MLTRLRFATREPAAAGETSPGPQPHDCVVDIAAKERPVDAR